MMCKNPVTYTALHTGTLLSMLITWLATGRPRYVSQDAGNIAYISDIGASYLKPLFIVGCCITAVCFILSLVIMNWLKHHSKRYVIKGPVIRHPVLDENTYIGSLMTSESLDECVAFLLSWAP